MATISGGDKLGKVLAEMAARISRPGTLAVGFLENATYPDGKPVAMIAAIQNYGTGTIPPRPFFSNMVRDKSGGWAEALAKILKAKNYDATESLLLMGEGIAGQLRQSIIDTNAPPLAPSTIAKRRQGMTPAQIKRADARAAKTGAPASYAKPLVDTGHMLGSIGYDVQ